LSLIIFLYHKCIPMKVLIVTINRFHASMPLFCVFAQGVKL